MRDLCPRIAKAHVSNDIVNFSEAHSLFLADIRYPEIGRKFELGLVNASTFPNSLSVEHVN